MLAYARRRATEERVTNVTFEQADAQIHPMAGGLGSPSHSCAQASLRPGGVNPGRMRHTIRAQTHSRGRF
jgi:hypothetical protein